MARRILICYAERLLRMALRSALNEEADLCVIGETGDGYEAVRMACGLRPEVVLIDERLAGLTGIEVAERLRNGVLTDAIRGVILLAERPDAIFEAARAGARGFVLRSSGQDELVSAIRAVASGDAFFTPQVASIFLRCFESTLPRHSARALTALTEREYEVLMLVADGLSNCEISGELYVSQATVKFHVSNLLSKLGLRDRVQIAVYAHKAGLSASVGRFQLRQAGR